jgi:nucleotide-binding universal stress UspA family protein
MFKNLLVPLDGSRLAEAALPAAIYLAETLGAKVTLLHVIERGAPQEIHGERHLTNPQEARAYLDEVAGRAFHAGMRVGLHVHTNEEKNVAYSIAEHAGELGSDLIVMCTHGRGGLRGFMFGRIAQQVAGLGATPVLLVPPDATDAATKFSCRRMLVPIDGDPEHEEGLNIGASLSKICGADLNLIMVVHELSTLTGKDAATAKLLPGATNALLNMAEQDAVEYLQGQENVLRSAGINAKAYVRRGDPAKAIIETAENLQTDLVVLATHGKSGMEAFWSGSATPNVERRSVIPLLLVPVGKRKPQN